VKRLVDALRPQTRVFVPGLSGESPLLLRELTDDPERARDVDFIGVQFPGIGQADYLSVHPQARQTAFFMSPAIRNGIQEQRADLLSLDYPGIARYLQQCMPFDLAIGHFSLPDPDGWCSTGICGDFLPIAWPRAARRVAQLNRAMPRTDSGFRVHLSELDAAVEFDAPLTEFSEAEGGGETMSRIGRLAAEFVRDGDTLQFGIGSVPLALARALTSHRRLRLHTGMVSQAARTLEDAGALEPGATIMTGVALGDAAFYDWAGRHPRLRFADVRETHNVQAMAAKAHFVAINSAMEVDLFGQVNAERGAGVLQAGAGGLPAFAQGALNSVGGRLLICMAATAKRGAVSRIVPALGTQSLCTLPRHMADVVVTEYGAAQVRDLSLDARAHALIAIAAPEHRAALQEAWGTIRNRL
jgi:acyl-CoA hydrolase